jgi:ferredoxin
VISYNGKGNTQPFWADTSALMPGITSSGAQMAKAAGARTPAANLFVAGDVPQFRPSSVVEKCTFCYHRTSHGLQPACVEVCPSKARIFGDQDDAKAEISQVLKAQKSFRLKEEKGTRPNVHYINKYDVKS